MRQELLKGLTEEQIARINACKGPEEIMAIAKQEGVELTDEQLEAINGGGCTKKMPNCPNCGSEYKIRR